MKKHATIIAALAAVMLIPLVLTGRCGCEMSEQTASKQTVGDQRARDHAVRSGGSYDKRQSGPNKNISISKTWLPTERLSHLSAGGVKIPIVFESQVSMELQQAIIYDLNLIFGHLISHEYLDATGAPEVFLDGELVRPERFLSFTGIGRYFPRELVGRIGFIVEQQLIIPASVIEAYTEAWSRKTANNYSYESLIETIDRINRISEEPISRPHDWMYLSEAAETAGVKLPEMSSEQFSISFGGLRYRRPSLLDVFEGTDWDPGLAGCLIAVVYVFDESGAIRNTMPPLIFMDGTWRFFIGLPPT